MSTTIFAVGDTICMHGSADPFPMFGVSFCLVLRVEITHDFWRLIKWSVRWKRLAVVGNVV